MTRRARTGHETPPSAGSQQAEEQSAQSALSPGRSAMRRCDLSAAPTGAHCRPEPPGAGASTVVVRELLGCAVRGKSSEDLSPPPTRTLTLRYEGDGNRNDDVEDVAMPGGEVENANDDDERRSDDDAMPGPSNLSLRERLRLTLPDHGAGADHRTISYLVGPGLSVPVAPLVAAVRIAVPSGRSWRPSLQRHARKLPSRLATRNGAVVEVDVPFDGRLSPRPRPDISQDAVYLLPRCVVDLQGVVGLDGPRRQSVAATAEVLKRSGRARSEAESSETIGRMRSMATKEIEFVFEPDPDGGYHAYAPELPGLHTEGDTLDEAVSNAEEALALYVEGLREEGRTLDMGVVRLTLPLPV